LSHNINQHTGLISQQPRQNFDRRAKNLARLHRCPELVNRAPGPDMRAYQHARLYTKSGGRNWNVKSEIEKHIMDPRHQGVSVLLQMSGVYIALQRFVKGIWQGQVPPQPRLRSRIGKRKMQPQEFIRHAGTWRGQELNRRLRSDRLCWLVGDKMITPN